MEGIESAKGSVELLLVLHGEASVVQHRLDGSELGLLIVEGDGHRVGVHVDEDGLDVLDPLDGRTGRRRGPASDDTGCL